jgi:hypothetical protein
MKHLTLIAFLVCLTGTAIAQTTPPPLPYDSAVLTWTIPTEFAAGGSLADPIDSAYVIEVSAPGGTGWGPVAIVRGANTYRLDKLAPGLWSFRVKSVVAGASFSLPSAVMTKTVAKPAIVAPVVAGVTIR